MSRWGLHPFTVLSDENEKNNILSECQLYKNLNKNACFMFNDIVFEKHLPLVQIRRF